MRCLTSPSDAALPHLDLGLSPALPWPCLDRRCLALTNVALPWARCAVDSLTLRRVAIKIINLRQLRKVRPNPGPNPNPRPHPRPHPHPHPHPNPNKVRTAEENLKHELAIHRRLKQVCTLVDLEPHPLFHCLSRPRAPAYAALPLHQHDELRCLFPHTPPAHRPTSWSSSRSSAWPRRRSCMLCSS